MSENNVKIFGVFRAVAGEANVLNIFSLVLPVDCLQTKNERVFVLDPQKVKNSGQAKNGEIGPDGFIPQTELAAKLWSLSQKITATGQGGYTLEKITEMLGRS